MTHPQRFTLHHGGLADSHNLISMMQQVPPDETYELAALSQAAVSVEAQEHTALADGIGIDADHGNP